MATNEDIDPIMQAAERLKDIGTQLHEARKALKAIQSQCSGHADEFSRNVWLLACDGLGEPKSR